MSEAVTKEQSDDEPSVMGAGCGLAPMPTDAERREAYKHLYVARMVAVSGITQEAAAENFEAGADSLDYDIPPEDAADAEMEYWTDDGDGNE